MLYTENGEKIETTASLIRNLVHYSDEALEEIVDFCVRWQEDLIFNPHTLVCAFEEIKDKTIDDWLVTCRYGYKELKEAEEDGFVLVQLDNGNLLVIDMDLFHEFDLVRH